MSFFSLVIISSKCILNSVGLCINYSPTTCAYIAQFAVDTCIHIICRTEAYVFRNCETASRG